MGKILHIAGNVIGVILCVVFIPLIIMNTILIVKSYTNPDRLPTVFGFSPVIVLSGSMTPEFREGDMIFLKETDPSTLQVGDVICYYGDDNKDTAVTHRIVEIHEQEGQNVFITRGDANNTEDRIAVTYEMVQGKYTGLYIPNLGNLAVFLQSTTGMVVCIVCPLLIIILWDVLRRIISSRKKAGTVQSETQAMAEELERLRAQVAGQKEEASVQAGESPEEGGTAPTP